MKSSIIKGRGNNGGSSRDKREYVLIMSSILFPSQV